MTNQDFTYAQYQQMIARYGFIHSLLTEQEYNTAYNHLNGDVNEIYSLACDIYCEAYDDFETGLEEYKNKL